MKASFRLGKLRFTTPGVRIDLTRRTPPGGYYLTGDAVLVLTGRQRRQVLRLKSLKGAVVTVTGTIGPVTRSVSATIK